VEFKQENQLKASE